MESQNTFLSRHNSFDGRRLPNSPLQALRETHVGIQNAGLPLNRSRMTHSEADLTLAEAASLPDSATVRHWDAVIDCAKSADARRRALRCVVSRIREVAGLHRGAQSKRRRPRSDWRASGCVTEAPKRTSSGCVDHPSSIPIRMSPTCGGVHDRRRKRPVPQNPPLAREMPLIVPKSRGA